jgi:ethanolamine transporter EutH
METIDKKTTSFGVSLAITSILSAILVLIKESSQSVLGLMKNMTGHHWITHGLIAVIAFFVIGWGLGRTNNGEGLKMTSDRLITILVGAIVLSGLIIAGFYLLED